jgi:hypothetical protein
MYEYSLGIPQRIEATGTNIKHGFLRSKCGDLYTITQIPLFSLNL